MRRPYKVIIIVIVLLAVAYAARFVLIRRQDIAFEVERIQQGPLPEEMVASDFKSPEGSQKVDEPLVKPEIPETTPPEEPADEPEIQEEPDPPPPEPTIPEPEEQPPPAAGPADLPASMNLDVPFVLQAPYAVWDAVDDDACEEASVIMVKGYLDGESSISKEQMRIRIDELVAHEMATLGYFEDTDAEQTAGLLTDFYGISGVQVLPVGSIDDVKRELAAGHPVILPAHGKSLQNPFFRGGGPDYHMLVAKGYTDTHIITNDPGTRRGEDFLYAYDILFDAIHDWNGGRVTIGPKLMIVVK